VQAALSLIDALDAEICDLEGNLRQLGAKHPYVPLLVTVPGVGWILTYTIGCELGDIERFSSSKKLCGYTGLCPKVHQSGGSDHRGSLTKNGARYLRWALIEAATNAARHPAYKEHHQRTGRHLSGRVRYGFLRCPTDRPVTDWYQIAGAWYQIATASTEPRVVHFAYVDGRLGDGVVQKLCRLRYSGVLHAWGFAIYQASHDDYEDSFLPSGMPAGSPEEALDCACRLYLSGPSAWSDDSPTN